MFTIIVQLFLAGLVAGILGGMFGIGGGLIIIPIMTFLLGMSQKAAIGTSLAAQLLPIGALAVVVYYKEGHLSIKYALLLALGMVLGNLFGASFTNQNFISDIFMKRSYGILMIIVGFKYLFLK